MFSQLHGMSPGLGKIAAHGVAGGIMSEMQGGSFKSGFLAAGFTQALSPAIGRIDSSTIGPSVERTIAAAIVGGTASVIGGGKFANGAVTGAFSRLFNDDAFSRSQRASWKGIGPPPAVAKAQDSLAVQFSRSINGFLDDLTYVFKTDSVVLGKNLEQAG